MLLGSPRVRRKLGEIFRLKSLNCLKKCLKNGKEIFNGKRWYEQGRRESRSRTKT